MKKLIITALVSLTTFFSLDAMSQEIHRRYDAKGFIIYVISGFSSTLAKPVTLPPDPDTDGRFLRGIAITYDQQVTDNTFRLSYVRGGYTNIVFTEVGTGTTFSWQQDGATGGWLILDTDTLICTSTATNSAQITLILDE